MTSLIEVGILPTTISIDKYNEFAMTVNKYCGDMYRSGPYIFLRSNTKTYPFYETGGFKNEFSKIQSSKQSEDLKIEIELMRKRISELERENKKCTKKMKRQKNTNAKHMIIEVALLVLCIVFALIAFVF